MCYSPGGGKESDTTGATYHSCSGDTDLENRLMDTVQGEEEEGGMYGERNTETYVTMCKIANGNLLYDSGNSNQGSVTT